MDLPQIQKLLLERLAVTYNPAPKRDQKTRAPNLEKLLDYSSGEMWRGGEYWRGRVPHDNDYSKIEKLFTADDQIKPALSRYVASIAGKDWEWDTKTTELVDPLSAWHADTRLHRVMQQALYLMFATGRSVLRIYIPDEYQDDIDSTNELEAALELIHVQVLDARDAGAIRDEHNREVGYFYRYTVRENEQDIPHVELHTPETIYRYRLEGNKLVVVRDRDGHPQEFDNPVKDERRKRRPRYLMFELNRDEPMLTPAILDKQDGLNVTWTNMRRNDDLSGFRSIVTLNAEDPVEVLEDGTERPVEWTLSPDIVVNLRGISKGENEDGDEIGGRETPSYGVIDPINPEYFLKTIDAWREGIASDFNQGFVFQPFKAVSGEGKREDRAAYNKTVTLESVYAVQAARWLLETVSGYAGDVIGNESFKQAEFDPAFFVDVMPGDLDTFIKLIPAYEKNLLSRDGLIVYSPVEDKEEEQAKLDARAALPTPPQPTEPEQENV